MNHLILIIDDSATIRKVLQTILQREGYSGMSFPDGIAALHWLAEHPDVVPALVFLDVYLPKMDGYEWARRIKALPRYKNTTIVCLSRCNGVIDKLKARLAGAVGSLEKPFITQTILTTVQTYLPTTVPR